jgi:hypothetical protein
LEVLFRDHYVYPFVQLQKSAGVPWENIRANLEVAIVNETRFVAVGGAAESGHSFLYDFRKANDLPMEAFAIDQDVIEVVSSQKIAVTPPSLRHLIYVDDFCATGQQVNDRAGRLIRLLKTYRPDIKISYYLLFATESAIANLKGSGLFDNVAAAVVFDPDYRVFGESSHFYKTPIPGVNLQVGREIMQGYGSLLFSDPLGFKNSQLLVGFNHNTPDNTLPVFWASESWQPIFHRAHKH